MTDRWQQIPPAATHDAPARCCLAIELSKTSWLVAVVTPLSEKIGIHKLAAGDAAALLELIARARARFASPESSALTPGRVAFTTYSLSV